MSAVQIIKPKSNLSAKVGRVPAFDPSALARAEAALNSLSHQFDDWMKIEAEKLAETLGIKVVVCPWLSPEQRPLSADGWKRFGERLQKIGKPFQDAGYTFGYHNHEFEFVTYDGRFGMDYLLEAAPAVDCEADVAWIVRGGADPAKWLEANGQRIIAVHVKDLAPAGEAKDEGGWADAGHGTIPWTTLWPIIRNKTRAGYFIAEHDNPNDIDRFASRSIAFIKSLGA
jgi:sugar phosphate isomerase/epimerase